MSYTITLTEGATTTLLVNDNPETVVAINNTPSTLIVSDVLLTPKVASSSGTTSFTLDEVSGDVTFESTLVANAGLTASQTISNYVTGTAITTTEFQTYVGQKIIYTGGAGEIDLPAAVAADIGKSWIIINAGTGALTIDVNGSGTAQYVRTLTGGSVATSNSADKVIAAGGSAELICIADASITNSSSVPNWLLYGGGIS